MAETNDPMVPRDDPEPGGDGLRWSFELDLESVLAQIGRSLGGLAGEDQEAILAAENEARDSRAPSVDLAGLVAEHLPAGPGLAAWLAQQDPGQLADRDLPGAAAAFRKVASWAQAAELKAVAQITARSAARDKDAGLEADGRPAQVTRDAAAQVGLGLALSPCGAAAWAGLAVTLNWRLPRTGAALADGILDLYRARIIAEATAPLSDEDARKVEDQLVPAAGDMTYGQLHAALRRAVIVADPEGAEHRRQAAERRARVSLYPDQDQTATLTGSTLPAVPAAAAMARITAMARALKASGAAGGTDYLRAHVFLGLLMGTLPLIPPPAGAAPDDEPPLDDDSPGDSPGDDDSPGDEGPPPGGLSRTEELPRASPPRASPPRAGPLRASPPRAGPLRAGPPRAGPPDGAPPGSGTSRHGPAPHPRGASPSDGSPPRSYPPRSRPLGSPSDGDPPDGSWSQGTAGDPPHVGDTGPPLTDADAPEDDGFRDSPPPLPDGYDDDVRYWGDPLDDHFADRGTVPALPPVPATVPAAPGESGIAKGSGRPPPGLLDVSVPWAALICQSPAPGMIGRIGPVTATQARQLARLALTSYTTRWRVVLTDDHGHAIAVGRVLRGLPPRDLRPPCSVSLVGRITVTMPATSLDHDLPEDTQTGEILHDILRAAARARARQSSWPRRTCRRPIGARTPRRQRPTAHRRASASTSLPGISPVAIPTAGSRPGAATSTTPGPWHLGGPTCRCNLGPLCRAHHILKQLSGWQLTQPQPGLFQWITPAGRAYAVGPDTHHN